MKVKFRNNARTTVWVAVMFYDPDICSGDGDDWGTRGWWRIEPGDTKWAFSTTNKYACFYAEAADGTIWAGNYGPVYGYSTAFDGCVGLATTQSDVIVDMRLITLPGSRWNALASHTVNLNI